MKPEHTVRGMPFALLLLAWAGSCGVLAAQESTGQYRPVDLRFRATASGNPFEVDLTGVVRGPDHAVLRVPGFYDGDGTWVVRFSAPAPGEWQLETQSSLPALQGQRRTITARPSANPKVHGLLQVDPDHPYHFRHQDGSPFFLMGYEADWLGLVDMRDRDRRVMRRLIEQMDSRGFNYVLVNVYAHDTRWAPGKSCEWDHGPPALYAFAGTNEKPDHSILNVDFFKAYDAMLWALWERGIIAHVMLKVYNKDVNWPAKGSPEEERFFRYVVARYQAFPNLVWDFAKESYNEKDERLQHRLLNLVRQQDAYGHLVTAHDDEAYEWDGALSRNLDFRTDQQHGDLTAVALFDRAFRVRPIVNAEFGYEYGVESLPTHKHRNQSDWKEFIRRAWEVSMAGSYTVYYYNNTAWDVVKPDPEPPGMAAWQVLKSTLSALPYQRMEPHPELAIGGACLAELGRAYICHVPGARATVNLKHLPGPAKAHWVNTWTGEKTGGDTVRAGVHVLPKPKQWGETPAALVVQVP